MADSSIGRTCAQPKPKTSRRTVLASIALAPLAALPAVAGTPDRSAWTAALHGFKMAFDAERIALKPYKAASAALTRRSLPTPKVAIKDERGEAYFYSLQFCERLIDGVPDSKRNVDPIIRQAFEAVDEHRRVVRENKRICAQLRVDELEAAWSSACDDRTEAENALLECAAPDLGAVIQKMDLLADEVDACELVSAVRADLARLTNAAQS